jgi:dolichol-phosphate mannosyltransferase
MFATREPGPVWLVLPTYNEAANLEPIAAAILEQLPPERRLLVVDDTSPDGTGEIADRLAAADPDVEVLHRPDKEGLGPAYVAGLRRALAGGAELIAHMDADFSHDPADLPRLLAAAADADVVLGSRYVAGGGVAEWGPGRRLISRGGSAYARTMLGVGIGDLTGGFKVFRGDRPRFDPVARLRVSDRDHLPGRASGLSRRRGADRLPRPAGR